MFGIVWLLAIASVGQIWVDAQTQRVAPGVPPQQYQQHQMHTGQQMHQQVPQQQLHNQQYQQPHAQHQQPPMQQAQPHVQHQQPPMQQQQHHQPQQQQHQVPIQHHQQQQGHHHIHDQNPQNLLNPANMAHEKEHIAEHLDVPMDTSKMTDQELQFHYFKMHDADNNNKLDGSELIKSLIHWHDQGNQAPGAPNTGDKIFTDDELVALIDPILSMDDGSQDGYIDYPEFLRAQQKAAASGN